jgi:hypothetical protein
MKRYLPLLILCLAALSCTQETELSIAPDVGSFQFDEHGGQFDAIIFTNGSWTATCDDPAVSFAPQSGDYTTPIHVSVGANEEKYTKNIRLALTATLDNLTRTGRIVITQACAPFIFCEEAVKTVGPEGGVVRFSVNSNEPWKVASQSCPVDPMTGGPNIEDVSLLVPENTEGVQRTFTVILSLEKDPQTTLVLTVVQQG